MADYRTWGWYQPGFLPGWNLSDQDNLDAALNGTVLSVADYREYFMRDLNGDFIIDDTDTDDGSTPFPGEGLVVDGVEYDAHEIAVYDNSTITVNGVDYSVRLVVTVLDNGAWGVRILDADIQPGWYPADITAARLGTFNGVEYSGTYVSSVDQMLCFAPEVPIRTPGGWRAAGGLRAGDRVLTQDGPRPLIWTARRQVDARHTKNAPVVIPPGVLGATAAIRLSPLHRVMVAAPQAALLFGSSRVLMAARHLLVVPGVVQQPVRDLPYIHLMTRAHSVLRCPGLWCESFQGGPWARRLLSPDDRARLWQAHPDADRLRPVFPVLGAKEARLLLYDMGLTGGGMQPVPEAPSLGISLR